MSIDSDNIESLVNKRYEHGFVTDIATESLPPGLDEDVITMPGRPANTELLLNINYLKPRIVEVPLLFRKDVLKRKSRVRIHRMWWDYVRMITRLWLNRR